jgi:SM-20-related protein
VSTVIAGIVDTLAERGHAIVPAFLAPPAIAALAASARARLAAGEFRAAGTGAGSAFHLDAATRGDRIRWLDPETATAAEAVFWERLEALRVALNEALFLGLQSFEGHFAVYPPGAFYRRHVDRFRDDDTRAVSLILYLNEAWGPADGGELVLETGEGTAVRVAPRGGTLVVFLSERLPHEVLPARRERLSLTGWFRRRALSGAVSP